MPVNVSAGVPASSVKATADVAIASRFNSNPSNGRGDDQRQSGREPVRQRFGGAGQFQRCAAHHDQIERTVVMIGHEQPVEREQAG